MFFDPMKRDMGSREIHSPGTSDFSLSLPLPLPNSFGLFSTLLTDLFVVAADFMARACCISRAHFSCTFWVLELLGFASLSMEPKVSSYFFIISLYLFFRPCRWFSRLLKLSNDIIWLAADIIRLPPLHYHLWF